MSLKKIGGTFCALLSVNAVLLGTYINTNETTIVDNIREISTYEIQNEDISLNFNSYIEATEVLKNIQVNNEIKINSEITMLEYTLQSPYMILVNKENLVDKTYKPDNLVDSSLVAKSNKEERLLDEEVSRKLTELFNDAKKDGINLKGVSGYRSYSTQQSIYKSRQGSKYVALPGASEHQTGYAIDILSKSYSSLTVGFEDTKEFKWLSQNCYKYGFILRYTKDKEDITGIPYEPWHYRYVGDSVVAEEIMTKGLSLEEYVEEANARLEELKEMVKN